MYAASNGKQKVAKLLLNAEADKEKQDYEG